MCSNNPEFAQEVLDCLKGDPADIEGFTAIGKKHHENWTENGQNGLKNAF